MENTISEEIYKILNEAKDLSTMYPFKSYAMCKEAYDIAEKNNLIVEEGYALIGMSFACRAKSDINQMLDCSYKALEIFDKVQIPLGKIKSLNLIGIAYFYNAMYEEALKYLLQVLDLLGEHKDYFLLSCVLNNIGEVFRESDRYDEALKYYNRALRICVENSFKINTASIFSNIGEIYFLENKYDEAQNYYTKSYKILIEEKDMIILGEVENKLGKVLYFNKNYSKAEEYLFSALNRLDSVNNKFYAIDVLVNIAKLKLEKNSNDYFCYFEKALENSEKINAKKKTSEVSKILAECYEKSCNYKLALEYFKKYCFVNDEIMTSNLGKKLEILKIELKHLKIKESYERIKRINKRLETEISIQRNELEKIQKSNEILEKKALEDELTGIPNRRYINYYLNETLERPLLYDERIALFMIDIDNFKKYNDYWGHSKGDDCLIKVANCLKDIQLKRKDIIGRYGGEEFIYYAKGLNYIQALELGNLIRTEVEKLCLNYMADCKKNVITISVGGILGKASDFDKTTDMIQNADEQLYKAKNMGRNITILKTLIE